MSQAELAKMTVAEKLDLLEALWDDLSQHPEQIPVPQWHLDVIEERLAAYLRDPSSARPMEDVLAEFEAKCP